MAQPRRGFLNVSPPVQGNTGVTNETANLRTENSQLKATITSLEARVAELEARLAAALGEQPSAHMFPPVRHLMPSLYAQSATQSPYIQDPNQARNHPRPIPATIPDQMRALTQIISAPNPETPRTGRGRLPRYSDKCPQGALCYGSGCGYMHPEQERLLPADAIARLPRDRHSERQVQKNVQDWVNEAEPRRRH